MGDVTAKGLSELAKGGGNYLSAKNLPPKGSYVTVVGIGTPEPNFKKTYNVPVLMVDTGDGHPVRFKISDSANARRLTQAGIPDSLEGIVGVKLWLIPTERNITGSAVVLAQIAEVVKA